ncbi:MAG TPA: polyprenyl synthetase family protein [Candidatus Thermoplasmatota archaeon]|nr:polyprenyl synthetase family protein [Candidatus Thermoplasmatota archaeon]
MGGARALATLDRIEDALRRVVDDAPAPIRAAVAAALAPPAKRLRPRVALLAYEAAGGRVAEEGTRAAVAAELFHAASLTVDDVVDGARTRRGRPAVHVEHGLRAALLAAGFLVNRAQRLAAGDDELPTLEAEHVRVFRDAVDQVLAAEALALARGGEATEAEWLEVARGKTGALFLAAAEGAARRADAPEPVVRALRRYGLSLGVAFQAADDVLDVMGDPARMGKEAGNDGGAPNLARVVGVEAALAFARALAEDAAEALEALPASEARAQLAELARGAARRDR